MSTTPTPAPTQTGWIGWGMFAAIILLVSGIFGVVQGLVAIIGPNTYFVLSEGELFLFDVAGWGWWNIIIGVAPDPHVVRAVRGSDLGAGRRDHPRDSQRGRASCC